MKKSSAFCPAYVTGIFTISDKDAAGAGFAIDMGMTTHVSEASSGRTKILINKSEGSATVSSAVLRRFGEIAGRMGILEIRHETEIPIGFGLGMSAAGALSLSLALNEMLGLGLPLEKCVNISHDSEVECGTGLSGVDAAAAGGMLMRASVSGPPERLPFSDQAVEFAFYTPIRTSTVIRSEEWKGKVNAAGEKALQALSKNKGWDGFVASSRQFAAKAELAAWCENEMKGNPRASMAMLGHTLFSDEKLMLPKNPFKLLSAKTSEEGARAL